MTTPGVTVRPIVTIDGGHEINEVIFENVRVPVENRVGNEGEGWTYAKFLLEHERNGTAGVAGSFQLLERLKAVAGSERSNGATVLDDERFRRATRRRRDRTHGALIRAVAIARGRELGQAARPRVVVHQDYGTEIQQAITTMMMEASAYGALDPAEKSALSYFNMRKTSIYAGSNEIQRQHHRQAHPRALGDHDGLHALDRSDAHSR